MKPTPPSRRNHDSNVNVVVFSPNGRQLVSCSNDTTVRVWDVPTGACLQILEGHWSKVNAVAYSPDGKQLVSCSLDGTVRIWDVSPGASLQTFLDISSSVSAVAFSPDGKQLASGSDNKKLRVRNLATGAVLWTFNDSVGATPSVLLSDSCWVYAVAFSPDGKQLSSSSRDKKLRVWDLVKGILLQIFELDIAVRSLSYHSDGSIMTDHGWLDVTAPRDNMLPSSIATLAPLGPRIFLQDDWIGYGEDRMLWLPPDYRPSCSAVRENIVCLGHHSGRVSIFEFRFPWCGNQTELDSDEPPLCVSQTEWHEAPKIVRIPRSPRFTPRYANVRKTDSREPPYRISKRTHLEFK